MPTWAWASDDIGYHPYLPARTGVRTLQGKDLAPVSRDGDAQRSPAGRDFAALDEVHAGRIPADPDGRGPRLRLPDGMVQRGNVVLPAGVVDGSLQIEPETVFAVEDLPGNEYPRKHTLYLNFQGGMLWPGSDNSAENRSNLAGGGVYPTFTQGNSTAVAVAQAVQADFEPYGVRVIYLERPAKVLPYTMEMVGGDWTDTNLDSPAGGVAPGADCGALGQRHVVYTFESSGATQMANTASQEAAHSFGLDHTVNCNSVMSYCGGGDQNFQNGCTTLCEEACQGPNTAGCRKMHETFCGVGSSQQDDHAEMSFLFGGNEPDVEPPTAEIVSPEDGAELAAGANVVFRALVDDNYGGYGWEFQIEKDGEVVYDQPDYDREVDEQYRAALNLAGLTAGTYTLRVHVVDHFGGEAWDEVTIHVGAAAGSEDGTAGESDGAGGSDGGMLSGATGGEDGSATGGVAGTDAGGSGDSGDAGQDASSDDPSPKGCACSQGSGSDLPWTAYLALGVPLALRRRRKNGADAA